MPINIAALNEHVDRVNEIHPNQINRRMMTTLLGTSLRYLNDVALPADQPETSFSATNDRELMLEVMRQSSGPSLRQQRYQLGLTFAEIMDSLTEVGFSDQDTLSSQDKAALQTAHRLHQSTSRQLASIAGYDVEPIRFKQWNETPTGRNSLARAVQEAQNTHGTKLTESVRRDIAKQTGSEFLGMYQAYMDSQFPTNQPDETRPKLTPRETLILGRQLYDAMAAQRSPESNHVGASLAYQVSSALVGAQNTLRWNLPAIEGIATEQWWDNAINQNFSLFDIAPSYDDLTKTHVQDQISTPEVMQLLNANVSAHLRDPHKPHVMFLESWDTDSMAAIMSLDKGENNRIAVLASNQDTPIIVTKLGKGCPDYLVVTAPDKGYQIVHCPDERGDLETRASNRKSMILSAVDQLQPNIKPEATAQRIEALHKRWRNLSEKSDYLSPTALKKQLEKIQTDAKNLALTINAPGKQMMPEHRDNLKELVVLAMLAGHENSERDAWRFRTPTGTATRPEYQPPALVVTEQTTQANGTVSITLHFTDEQGRPSGEGHQFSDIPKTQLAQTLAKEISKLAPTSRDIGKPVDVYHGLITHTATPNGDLIQSGHWLSNADKKALTHATPLGLAYANLSGNPLFPENWYRTNQDAQSLKDAAVYLIHGESISPEEAGFLAEMASYDGDYALKADLEDFAGSPKIRIDPFLFHNASTEDVRRHIIQKIALSPEDQSVKDALIERVRTTSLTKAEHRMQEAFEHYDTPVDDVAPGI